MHYFNLTWFSKLHLRVIKRIINKSLVQYFSSQKLFLCPSLFQFQPQTTKLFKVMCFVLKPTKLIFYLKTSIICLHGSSSCCEFIWVMQVLNASTSYELESLQIYLGTSLVKRRYPICCVIVCRAKISLAKIVVLSGSHQII